MAFPGGGKRGGARTLVATKMADRWFFLYGFAKSEQVNVTLHELRVLQEVAKELLGFDEIHIVAAKAAGEILEICNGDDKI